MGVSLDPAATLPRDVARAWILGFVGVVLLVVVTATMSMPRFTALTLGLTGMGILVVAWLDLGRQASAIPVRRLYQVAASWCLPLLVAPPLFSSDVRSYQAQGLTAAHGLDPYLLGPAEALGTGSAV